MNISKIKNIFFYINKHNNTIDIEMTDRTLNTVMHNSLTLCKKTITAHVCEAVDSKSRAAKAALRLRDIEEFHPTAHTFYHGKVENLNIDITFDNRTSRTSIIIREVHGKGKRDTVVFGTFSAAGNTRKGSLRQSNVSLLSLEAAKSSVKDAVMKKVGKWDAAVLANKAMTQTDKKQFVRNLLKNDEMRSEIHREIKRRERTIEDKAFVLSLEAGNDIDVAMEFATSVKDMVNDAREEATVEAADKSNEELVAAVEVATVENNEVNIPKNLINDPLFAQMLWNSFSKEQKEVLIELQKIEDECIANGTKFVLEDHIK